MGGYTNRNKEWKSEMLKLLITVGIGAFIGLTAMAGIACCHVAGSEDDPQEDQEQMEYLRKWREEYERKQILESDDVRRKKRR